MKLFIVTHSSEELFEKEGKKFFDTVTVARPEELRLEVSEDMEVYHKDLNLSEFDGVLLLPKVERNEFFYMVARILEDKGVYLPVNSSALKILWNKPLVWKELSSNGIKIRKVYSIAQNVALGTIRDSISFPVLVTTPEGKKVLATNEEVLKDVLSLFRAGNMVMIEKPLKAQSVIWSFVVGNEVVASYERIKDSRVATTLDDKLKSVSVKIREVLGLDFCAVSFVKMKREVVVNSVTISPDWELFTKVTGKNLVGVLLSYVANRIKERRKSMVETFVDMLKDLLSKV